MQSYIHFKSHSGINVYKVLGYILINLMIPYLKCSLTFMLAGVEDLNDMQSLRLVKKHLPVQLLPSSFWKNNCKVANF